MDERKKTTPADVRRRYNEGVAAEVERRKQAYQTAYENGEEILPWGLRKFLDGLPGDSYGESLNELAKQGGDIGVVYERAPGVIPAIVELIVRELKFSPPVVAAALGLPPSRDALDMLLLAVVRELAHKARNGLLPLSLVVAEVNAGCGEGLSPRFLAHRLRVMGCVLTAHHPGNVVVIQRLLPPVLDATLTRLLPSPEEPRAHEYTKNGSRTE